MRYNVAFRYLVKKADGKEVAIRSSMVVSAEGESAAVKAASELLVKGGCVEPRIVSVKPW